MKKNLVKKGQCWRSRDVGKIMYIKGKSTGNGHWNTQVEGSKDTHHTHEGTIIKFYKLIK